MASTDRTEDLLAQVATGGMGVLDGAIAASRRDPLARGIDPRTASLARLTVLFALDGPPASYAEEVAGAIEAGASPEEIAGVLLAVVPLIGEPRAVAAAPELMLALALPLPESAG